MGEKIIEVEKKINEIESIIKENIKFNLVGEEIIHKKYGKGIVVKQDASSLEINFEKDIVKTFSIDALVSKKLLKATNEKLQKQLEYIDSLNIEKQKYSKEEIKYKEIKAKEDKEKSLKNNKIKLYRKVGTEKLIKILCKEIEEELNKINDLKFYAKEVEFSCIQISKKGWRNEGVKGVHFEVWSPEISKGNVYGNDSVDLKIALHVEGNNMEDINLALENRGIYKSHNKVIEEENITLDFSKEEEIKKSIVIIMKKLLELNNKYTSKIDDAIKEVNK